MITLTKISLPKYSKPLIAPGLPLSVYQKRLTDTVQAIKDLNIDYLVIHADREHSAHQEFLIGVGPRFEESILIIGANGKRMLLLGNECMYLPPDPALGIEIEIFQDFSPPNQKREISRPIESILRSAGISTGQRIGTASWKTYSDHLVNDVEHALDIPSFLADELRRIVGSSGDVINANSIFIGTSKGLRLINDAHQIAQFEYAAGLVSNSVFQSLSQFAVGISERAAASYFATEGQVQSCHPMLSFGEKARRGLSSPSDNKAKLGDPFSIAVGVAGALTARASMVAHSEKDLSSELQEFFPKFSQNYWLAIVTWYENISIGAQGRDVVAAVEKVIDKNLYSLSLNPGHNLHIEEWVQSIFTADCTDTVKSGMVLQADLIPISAGPFCTGNVEDGIAVADIALQAEIKELYPQMWDRMQKRREFMKGELGITLDSSVLPLSDTCGIFAPYALELAQVYTKK